MSIFAKVKERAAAAGITLAANTNIAALLEPGDMEAMQVDVERAISALLRAMCIEADADHNTEDTARRVAKMYLREVCHGRYDPPPSITDFPNAARLDEIYTLGPITVRSMCSHHMCPITGQCWVGVIPSDRVIGISKFARIVDWVMARPQIQEEATVMLADTLSDLIKPKALAVVVRATHNCMTWRGVKETDTSMVTSVVRGTFAEKDAARAELFSIFKAQGF